MITKSKSELLVTDNVRLMRFIYESQETTLAAQVWSQNLPLLTASCFFWLAGTETQKSRNGLLRSLIHNLLRQAPCLVPISTPSRWRAAILGSHQQPWTNTELENTLLELLGNGSRDYRFCIFVDGLDEFEGDHRCHSDLVDFLVKVSSCKGVKLCVSSRPYPAFKSGFEDFPKLRMELLTRNDIETYTIDRLEEIKEFGTLKAAYPTTCSNLIEEIVDKAKGVFLWVYLVVRSLKLGLVEGDSMAALVARLRELPPDLDEVFYSILQRIPIHQRHYAAAYFQMVAQSVVGPLSLLTFWFVEEGGPDFLGTTPVEPLAKEVLRSRHLMLTRRLEGRCGGLLEIQRTSRANFHDTPAEYTVDYLHRSVSDFLLSQPAQKLLSSYLHPNLDVVQYLCQATLTQLKMTFLMPFRQKDTTSVDVWDDSLNGSFSRSLIFLLKDWEDKSGQLQSTIFQSMVSMFRDHARPRPSGVYGLFDKFVVDSVTLVHESHILGLISKHEEYNLDLSGLLFYIVLHLNGSSGLTSRCRIIVALLQQGANSNTREYLQDRHCGTSWEKFLAWEQSMYGAARRFRETPGHPQPGFEQEALLAARSFIEHGAASKTSAGESCGNLLHLAFPGPDGDELVKLLNARSRPKSRLYRATQKLLGRRSVES